jgi:hypothetical protein
MTTHLKIHIGDEELADAIINRLNKLCEDPEVRKDIAALIETRIVCSEATLNHPTIQASGPDRNGLCECGAYGGPGCSFCKPQFGFLGILNGLVGAMPDGPRKGWGYLAANFEDDGTFTGFQRTKNE